jgi:uroporphyrinogen III methyltransferase/synthase
MLAAAGEGEVAAGLLVVGKVAGLREHLRWFDERPLFGTRIVVTRSREQAGDFVDRLHDLGAEVIEAPSIHIEPLDDYDEVDRAIEQFSTYHWLVFTSANGVDHFMRRALARVRDIRDLHGPRICAVGPATAERLQRLHLRVDVMPEDDHAEGVIAALTAAGSLEGQRMLLPRADIAREMLPEELRQAGAEVDDIAAYSTVRATWGQEGQPDIYKKLLEGDVDIVTFTSASSVRHFVTNLGEEQAADLLQQVAVASIGPVTAEAAQQLGVATSIMPQAPYTIPSLVDAIVAHVRSRRQR